MNKKLFVISGILIILISGVFFLINSSNSVINNNEKIQVVTSFYPMYFFASQIGGDRVNVINITPAATEPHDYELTTQQIIKINQSNMLILNGGGMEAWGNKVKDQLADSNVLVVTAGEGLINKELNENGKRIMDPHIYLDPVLAKKQVENIKQGFEKIDPANKAYYQVNSKKLEDDLDKLNFEYTNGLSNCLKNDFITSHAAFGYLAARYKISQISISGISPNEEPSAQKLAQITQIIKQKDIEIIFFENLVSPKLSDVIANETGARTMALDPIEGITNDNLKKGETYLTVMRVNLVSLQEALQCSK